MSAATLGWPSLSPAKLVWDAPGSPEPHAFSQRASGSALPVKRPPARPARPAKPSAARTTRRAESSRSLAHEGREGDPDGGERQQWRTESGCILRHQLQDDTMTLLTRDWRSLRVEARWCSSKVRIMPAISGFKGVSARKGGGVCERDCGCVGVSVRLGGACAGSREFKYARTYLRAIDCECVRPSAADAQADYEGTVASHKHLKRSCAQRTFKRRAFTTDARF